MAFLIPFNFRVVTKECFWQTALDKPVDDNYIFKKSLDRENIFGTTCFYFVNSSDGVSVRKIGKTWINFHRII